MATPTGELEVEIPIAPKAVADAGAKGGMPEINSDGAALVSLESLRIDPPSLQDQRSLASRVAAALGPIELPHAALRSLTVLSNTTSAEAVVFETPDYRSLVTVHPPGGAGTLYGLAVDIGTTTVGAYLLDLGRRRIVAAASQLNAQASYGADVLSRIVAFTEGHPVCEVIRTQISSLARELARQAGTEADAIAAATVVGNTTMTHLYLGLDPATIGRSPFVPVTTEAVITDAAEVGLAIAAAARVVVLPAISAYVGADIVADLLVAQIHKSGERSLLVDIGTNGEVVLGDGNGILACSTAAGPAFEGASITFGSGGVDGAIAAVTRAADGSFASEVIGGGPARSICGSGLIDALALLLESGAVDETGRITDGEETDGELAISITDAIRLTQGDIRQVQLAKAAIAAGVRTLLESAHLSASDLDHVYLCGGFGTYVRPESALRIGLLPAVDTERIIPLGNAAGGGAANAMACSQLLRQANEIAVSCRYLELSGSAEFQQLFVDEMIFPER